MSFDNTYFHNVDKKGRIFIPAKFREELGERFYVSIPLDGQPCISVYTEEIWNTLEKKFAEIPMVQRRALLRVIHSFASDESCDAQGRILISPALRKYAHIEDSVCIVGAGDTIEIWNKQSWEDNCNNLDSESISELMKSINF